VTILALIFAGVAVDGGNECNCEYPPMRLIKKRGKVHLLDEEIQSKFTILVLV
jgi:hypothetical protein